MFSVLTAGTKLYGKVELRGMSIAGDEAEEQFDTLVASVGDGLGACSREIARMSWFAFAVNPFPDFFAIGPAFTASLGTAKRPAG